MRYCDNDNSPDIVHMVVGVLADFCHLNIRFQVGV